MFVFQAQHAWRACVKYLLFQQQFYLIMEPAALLERAANANKRQTDLFSKDRS